MFMSRKWALTLGILAVTPGITMAGPFSLFKRDSAQSTAGKRERGPNRANNQQVAEKIASALRSKKFDRYDIDIEYQNGVAILSGAINSPSQKASISRLVKGVRGVDRVENRLTVASQPPMGRTAPQFGAQPMGRTVPQFGAQQIRQVGAQSNPFAGGIQQAGFGDAGASNQTQLAENNQRTAEQVAKAISSVGLNGYDIQIRFENGIAQLAGSVSNPQQWREASQAVYKVPGVQRVDNRLRVENQQQAGPISQASFQGGAPMPPQAGYGHPGQGASQTVYNMPNMPDNAWPAMAKYPNSAQISYPKQYSASAWPYIGPFYPYPQVPLGWRSAQLAWDDGQWVLKFSPQTDKWWWFMNPENW